MCVLNWFCRLKRWEIAGEHVWERCPSTKHGYLKKQQQPYLLESTFAVQKLWSYVPFRIRRSYVYFKFDEYFPADQLWSVLTETSSVWVTSLLHRSINWSSSPRLLPLVNHRMWLDNYLKKHPSFPPQPGWLIQYGCHSITVGWLKNIPFFIQSLNHCSSSPPCS